MQSIFFLAVARQLLDIKLMAFKEFFLNVVTFLSGCRAVFCWLLYLFVDLFLILRDVGSSAEISLTVILFQLPLFQLPLALVPVIT